MSIDPAAAADLICQAMLRQRRIVIAADGKIFRATGVNEAAFVERKVVERESKLRLRSIDAADFHHASVYPWGNLIDDATPLDTLLLLII